MRPKYFPTLVVDDFLENPDKVRQMALAMEYLPNNGYYPGTRTDSLHLVNKNLFDYLSNRFFSFLYDFNSNKLDWNVSIVFQKINSFSEDKMDSKNQGWVHNESQIGTLLAGVLYLNPNSELYTGTNICKPIKENFDYEIDIGKKYVDTKVSYYRDNIKPKNYEDEIEEHNSMFVRTTEVANIYNRLIMFDADLFHQANNYHSYAKEPRLTCCYFVNSLSSSCAFPLERMREQTMERYGL
jgi:hypothetical protein